MERLTYKSIPFSGTVAAGGELTLASQLITLPFEIVSITTSFELNTNRTVQQKFFISGDSDAPTTGEPSGVNIFTDIGQVDYIIGDDEQKFIIHHASVDTGNSHVKVYANNTDNFPHAIDAIVTIHLLPRA